MELLHTTPESESELKRLLALPKGEERERLIKLFFQKAEEAGRARAKMEEKRFDAMTEEEKREDYHKIAEEFMTFEPYEKEAPPFAYSSPAKKTKNNTEVNIAIHEEKAETIMEHDEINTVEATEKRIKNIGNEYANSHASSKHGAKQSPINYKEQKQWATHAISESWGASFLWSPTTKTLLDDLLEYQCALIGLIGWQGVGKSITAKTIYHELLNRIEKPENQPILVKWFGEKEFYKQMLELLTDQNQFTDLFMDNLGRLVDEKSLGSWIQKKLGNSGFYAVKKFYTHGESISIPPTTLINALTPMMGNKAMKNLVRDTIQSLLICKKALIIDLSDYSKKNRSKMDRHLDEIEHLWSSIMEHAGADAEINFVVCIQKELFSGHFLLGKMDTREIKPFKPSELAMHYVDQFDSGREPFTMKALFLIGDFSRGIFRRFKEYISFCLTKHKERGNRGEITAKNISDWITNERLADDHRLMFADMFPRDQKIQTFRAIQVWRHLLSHGATAQAELEKLYFDSQPTCSRLVTTLEAHGIVKSRIQIDGSAHRKIVELA